MGRMARVVAGAALVLAGSGVTLGVQHATATPTTHETVRVTCEGAPTQSPGTGDFDVRSASGEWVESCAYDDGGKVAVDRDAYLECQDARANFTDTDGVRAGRDAFADCMSALILPEGGE